MAFCSISGKLRRGSVQMQNGRKSLSMQNSNSMALFCRMAKCVGEYTLLKILFLFQGILCFRVKLLDMFHDSPVGSHLGF